MYIVNYTCTDIYIGEVLFFFSRMENLVNAVFSNGRWENPKEFDTWKIPGKLEFLKMRLKDTDESQIPSDPKVYQNILLQNINASGHF